MKSVGAQNSSIEMTVTIWELELCFLWGNHPRTMALLREMGRKKQLVPWTGASELMDDDRSRYPVRLDSFFSFLKVPTLGLLDNSA